VRPGRKTGTRSRASKDSAVMVRVGRAGRAGRAGAGTGTGTGASAGAGAGAGAAKAVGADRREDILRTVRSVTGQGQARSGYRG
jgi:hypothetical protein